MAWPLVLDYFQGERRFFAQAAELSGEAITVDLHCHPNLSGGGKLPEFDPEVPDNMRTGGLDVGVFAIRGDLSTIRRDSSGLYTEYKDMTAIAKKGGIIGIWPLLRRRDTLETYLRSIDYVKNLVGADHLGIATDLFGLAGSSAVPSHKEFAIIPAGLLQRGYSQTHVAKIVGGNFIGVFREVTETRG
jgi:Membrane dipeptidase (Peptidase family M19)